MRRWWVGALLVTSTVTASPIPRDRYDAETERRFRTEVAAANAEAAEAFDLGNREREAGHHAQALAAFEQASRLAPRSDHTHRRVCIELGDVADTSSGLSLHDREAAECSEALALAPSSPYDQIALALALSDTAPPDYPRALTLARKALATLGDTPELLGAYCTLLRENDRGSETDCVEHYYKLAPHSLGANYLLAKVDLDRGDVDEAIEHLDAAHEAGLADDEYAAVRRDSLFRHHGDDEDPYTVPMPKWVYVTGAIVVVPWIAGLLLLIGVGFALSRLADGAARRAATPAGSTGEYRLRTLHRAVLVLAGLYFYISIVVLLATLGTLGFFTVKGSIARVINDRLALLIFIVVGSTILGAIAAVFARTRAPALGDLVSRDQAPDLYRLCADVATVVGTPAIDAVYLQPGTELFVTERAGLWAAMHGTRRERALVLGVALFDALTVEQLRSILAHELGHFRHGDSQAGAFALAVRRSLVVALVHITKTARIHDAIVMINPAFWFLVVYRWFYVGISQGASRLQEVIADRVAIEAYGSDAFISAYSTTIRRSIEFTRDGNALVDEVVKQKLPLENVYEWRRVRTDVEVAEIDNAFERALRVNPDRYDSHPTHRQRIEFATALAAAPRQAAADRMAPMWSLFPERDAIERAMTAVVRDKIFKVLGAVVPAH